MSIIRPFRADDLFKFNNMLRAISFLLRLNSYTSYPPEISTFGPRQCASEKPALSSVPSTLTRHHTVWPRLLFQLSFPLARYVLHRPTPHRSTHGIWHVSTNYPYLSENENGGSLNPPLIPQF